MSTISIQHIFHYPWHKVTLSFWEKYPSPQLPHVKEALILSRSLDEQGRLRTKRLMCVQQPVPAALKAFTRGMDLYYAIEDTVVDPQAKTLELSTRNMSFSRVVVRLPTFSISTAD